MKIAKIMKKLKIKPHKIIDKTLSLRHKVILGILAVGFILSITGLAKAMIIKADEYRAMAEGQQLNDSAVPAERGTIYDRNMTVLAQSATVWDIYIRPNSINKFPDEAKKEVYDSISSILGLDRDEIVAKFSQKDDAEVLLKSKVKKDVRDKVIAFSNKTYEEVIDQKKNKKKKYSYSKVTDIKDNVERFYPYKTFAANVIGSVGSQNKGICGMESKFDSLLMGIDGRIIAVRAAQKATDMPNIEYQKVYEPVQGTSIVLTLDGTIQRYLEEALLNCYETSRCDTCYGIVMDVKTGAILGMATEPGYDPNNPYEYYDEEACERLYNESLERIRKAKIEAMKKGKNDDTEYEYEFTEADKEQAWRDARDGQWANRAVYDTYEPGSVFKLITMAAGLEENVISMDTEIVCNGSISVPGQSYLCNDHGGHGKINLTEALMKSCNPYFITVGQRLGVEKFYKYLEAFGFTEKTGIDLPSETAPVLGTSIFYKDKMTPINLASSSFGQSFEVTAIQMITAVNAIANGGKLMKPYIIEKTLDAEGAVTSVTKPYVKRQVISESTAGKILSAMEQVSISGTGKNSYVAGYKVAGKTGTSDKLREAKGNYVASFAGCAPANDPEVSVIIVVDTPQGATTGSTVAAPVAGEVLEKTLTYLNVERQYSDSEKEKLDKPVPDVLSLDVSKAREIINDSEFKIKVIGDGDKVVSQMPVYGQYIRKNGVIIVYTEENAEKEKAVVPDFSGMSISEANDVAVAAGVNIKISGNSLKSTGFTAYKQTVAPGKEVEYGSILTVYFRTTTGVDDH